jgi:protein-S-isoprenylcysteine O-methyltransferase Ste14
MSRKPLSLLLSAFGWLWFNLVIVWTMAFLAGVLVPRVVDGPSRSNAAVAVTVDLGLLLVFAVQHSAMARPEVKVVLRRSIPAELERTAYVLATNACLTLLVLLWQPFGGRVWQVDGPVGVALWVLCATGWLLAIAATYAVDHLELTGLRQGGWAPPRNRVGEPGLQVAGMYSVVRHPLMTGLVLAFWATPRMGAGHLLFAAAASGYVLVGIRFEERDLRRTFGEEYEAYAARVPALVPRLRVRRALEAARD